MADWLAQYSTDEVEQARVILDPKVYEDQMDRALQLCGQVAAEWVQSLTYTAMKLTEIMLDKPERRTVIEVCRG